MTKTKGTFLLKSEGALNFYFGGDCLLEKLGDAYTVSFEDIVQPGNLVALALSKENLTVMTQNVDEDDDIVSSDVGFFDFNKHNKHTLNLDFKVFRVVLTDDQLKYTKTANGAEVSLRGFLTKSDRKTDKLNFVLGIYELSE